VEKQVPKVASLEAPAVPISWAQKSAGSQAGSDLAGGTPNGNPGIEQARTATEKLHGNGDGSAITKTGSEQSNIHAASSVSQELKARDESREPRILVDERVRAIHALNFLTKKVFLGRMQWMGRAGVTLSAVREVRQFPMEDLDIHVAYDENVWPTWDDAASDLIAAFYHVFPEGDVACLDFFW
jgi:hypothetical protein